MRLLLINEQASCVGGAELHLRHLLPGLLHRGHEIAFLHQEPVDSSLERIVPAGIPAWCLRAQGAEAAGAAQQWHADVLYAHRLIREDVLRGLITDSAAAFFIHGYFGVCISMARCMKAPTPRPCARRFGPGCLAMYFPRRCGGWNPITMWKDYRREQAHQRLLHEFDLLLTHSEHVRSEYVRHGFPQDRTRCLPFFVAGEEVSPPRPAEVVGEGPLRLLFLGRFDVLKGGQLFLRALPLVHRRCRRPVEAVFAGDGPARNAWENLAVQVVSESGGQVTAQFPGWLTGDCKASALAEANVLVVPSVWPEPFGMTGIEAGFHGVPAVAFDVGGVRSWLRPGVNGCLAPGSPPTPQGLADAIVKTIADPQAYERLRAGARSVAAEFSLARHLDALEEQFQEARRLQVARSATAVPSLRNP